MAEAFASSAGVADKEQTLEVLADGVYALTAEGDPNVGAVEGEDFLVCFEALVLSHYLDAVAALGAGTLVGGRGAVVRGRAAVDAAIAQTRDFLAVTLRETGAVHDRGGTPREAFEAVHAALEPRYGRWPIFEHCPPFDVSRLRDELSGVERPRIWIAERDRQVWAELRG